MQIELKGLDQIEFFNGFTEKDINKNEKAQLKLINSSLSIVLGGKMAAKVVGGQFGYEVFTSKLILYNIKDKKHKHIILEVSCDEKNAEELAKLIKRRNVLSTYRDPLKLDYSRNICESVLSTSSGPANLRGFFNLFIIFSCLNYSRMIIEHSFKYGPLFSRSVELLDLAVHRQPGRPPLCLFCAAVLQLLLRDLRNSEDYIPAKDPRVERHGTYRGRFDRLPPAVYGHGLGTTGAFLSAN